MSTKREPPKQHSAWVQSIQGMAEFALAVGSLSSELDNGAKRLRKAVSEECPDLDVISQLIRDLKRELDNIASLGRRCEALEQAVQEYAERRFLELESDIREACAARRWRVDGQWPTLYIERGVSLEIDEKKRVTKIGDKRFLTTNLSRIVDGLEEQVADLLPSVFSPPDFMRTLAHAYDQVSIGAGGLIAVWDLYRAFVVAKQPAAFWRDARKTKFTGVSVDQFRAQLSKTLEHGINGTSDGRQLRLFPPINPKDAIFVYLPAESRFGFVGRVEFVNG